MMAFLLFLYLLLRSGQGGLVPPDLFFRLDPLAGIAGMVAARQLVPGLVVGAVVALVAALLLGRAWCGWLCPLGAALDCAPARRAHPQDVDLAAGWRRAKYFLLAAIFVAALFGNLTLLFLDPITIVYRTVAAALWPALNALITAAETALYDVPFARGAVDVIESALRGRVLPTYQPVYSYGVLAVLFFLGILALNAARPRFWCRYLCPLGALLALPARVAGLQRSVSKECVSCQRCTRACPMGTIETKRNYESDPAECTLCLECVSSCAKDGQAFGVSLRPTQSRPYDPSRRQFVASAGAAVVMLGLLGSEAAAKREDDFLIRPPGAQGTDFLSRCIRCGACLQACPTSGLQPSLGEAGWAGAWTPVLVPRLGYCQYDCNACGRSCPTGAIPPLSLEDKQQAVIGRAYIDQNRCIPWTDARTCTVCEEMCPLPEKAIVLEDVEVSAPGGEPAQVKRPHVVRERCIGCGLCENHCPLVGAAAIRVYVPPQL